MFPAQQSLSLSLPRTTTISRFPVAQQMWKCKYIETSAKEGTNVTELFEELLKLDSSR